MTTNPELEVRLMDDYSSELNDFFNSDVLAGRIRRANDDSEIDSIFQRYEGEAKDKLSIYKNQIEKVRNINGDKYSKDVRFHESRYHYYYGRLNFVRMLAGFVRRKYSTIAKLTVNLDSLRNNALIEFQKSIDILDNPDARFGIVDIYLFDYNVVDKGNVSLRTKPSIELAVKELDDIIRLFGDDEEVYLGAQKQKNELEAKLKGGDSSGGCFIATAVYSSYDAPEVLVLRRFRDEKLQNSILGRAFVHFYYAVSPPIAKILRHSGYAKNLIRRFLLDPMVLLLKR